MVRALNIIEIEGRRVEVLFTPSLYGIANRKGVKVQVEDTSDMTQVMEAYMKIIYLAAINAHEVRRFDNPELGEFDLSLMDICLWAQKEPKAFAKAMREAVEALTGKPAEGGSEEVKKK